MIPEPWKSIGSWAGIAAAIYLVFALTARLRARRRARPRRPRVVLSPGELAAVRAQILARQQRWLAGDDDAAPERSL